ncbi:MAG: alanine racemase [Rhodospirillaceae bacterium]|nr:alanine racemase [Rhodospirillaceae bacterium]|tara:strand:+ start:979 stop:2151 length:1173 start_codon:yes stop_codon:yes gene_type:complete
MLISGDDTRFGTHPAWMEIDAQALRHNLKQIRKRAASNVMVIGSVKANGYGHGVLPICKILEEAGVDMLTTGSFSDARILRNEGITTPIVMLGGALPVGISELVQEKVIPTIYNIEAANAVDVAAGSMGANGKIPVFIKVDCGMGRLGISLSGAVSFIEKVSKLKNLWIQGLYTHLSFKDENGMAFAEKRLILFYDLIGELKKRGHNIPITQALASSALAVGWQDQCSAICPGHLLYGLPSIVSHLGDIDEFLPVCKNVRTRVIHLADHQNDPNLRSGGYHTERSLPKTGVVPFGLNDGNRSFSKDKKPVVLFKGQRLPVLGVSLEHLTFEMPNNVAINLGDVITIIGKSGNDCIGMEEFSSWFDSTSLETMLSLSNRMPIILRNENYNR